ncbi:hypothetical protein PTKIN_Ptkin11bG0146200 [Pterospermum kingtungense]
MPSCFQPDNLVALLLPNSCIEQLWKDSKLLYKLEILNIEGSKNLIKTPDFEMIPNIESLNFEACTKLVDLHPSIAFLRRLKLLNLSNCKRLRSLPTKIGMGYLQKLILQGCSNLKRFPEIDEEMQCLVEFYLDGTGIEELPSSIGHLSNLVLLSLKDCKNLVSLSSSVHGLKCLKFLNLSGCSKIENLPKNLQQVEFLEELGLSETAVIQRGCTDAIALTLPRLLGLSSLTRLNLSYCNLCDGAIPSDICYLSCLETLEISGNNFTILPATITRLSKLHFLQFSDCKLLKALPDLQSSIEALILDGCASFEVFVNPSTESTASIYYPSIGGLRKTHGEFKNAATIIKRFLKQVQKSTFETIRPGSDIPEWFNKRDESSPITIYLPPNIRNDSQWVGDGENQECSEIELTIGLVSAKVKKCGVAMVYEKDLELLKLVTNSIFADNFDDINQDATTVDGSIGSVLKRKYNTVHEEEAG